MRDFSSHDAHAFSRFQFERLQTLSGTPFTLEACPAVDGQCVLVPCLDGLTAVSSTEGAGCNVKSGHHIWANAPFHLLFDCLKQYLSCKALSPHNTSACFVVPKRYQNFDWQPLLKGMHLLHEFPKGSFIYEDSSIACPWPVQVFYDPVRPQLNAFAETHLHMMLQGTLSGAPVNILIDSGAGENFLSTSYATRVGFALQPSTSTITIADGSIKIPVGVCRVRLAVQGYSAHISCTVTDLPHQFDMILGNSWLQSHRAVLDWNSHTCCIQRGARRYSLQCTNPSSAVEQPAITPGARTIPLTLAQVKRFLKKGCESFHINVKPSNDSALEVPLSPPSGNFAPRGPDEPDSVQPLIEEFKHLFPLRLPKGLPPDRGLGSVIPMIPDAMPKSRPLTRLSPLEFKEMEATVKELLEQGFIEPCSSPFGASILFVRKKDGTLRMVFDYRALNQCHTRANRVPVPNINTLFDNLHGAKVMSSLDLLSAYHQIRLCDEDVPRTAFRTQLGTYCWRVLPFGLKNAVEAFSESVTNCLRPFIGKFVLVYLDDILIWSSSPEEHLAHLKLVLDALDQHQFYLKRSKCEFFKTELKFLGHVVSSIGLKVDPSKVSVVMAWPTPTDIRALRSFLGLANYFRRFIKSYAIIVHPLYELLRKNMPFVWTNARQLAFDSVKTALTNAPVLAIPDLSDEALKRGFQVWSDASGFGIGAVLLQDGAVIAYEGRALTPAQKDYTVGEQELLAVVHALGIWRCYLEGANVTVCTDHAPNTFLPRTVHLSRRQARWSEFLQRFDITWQYKPGKINMADPISRCPSFLLCSALWTKSLAINGLAIIELPDVRDKRYPPSSLDALFLLTSLRGLSVDHASSALAHLDSLRGRIVMGYVSDPWFLQQPNIKDLTLVDSLYYFNGAIVVPSDIDLKRDILYEAHNAAYSGHLGITKTQRLLERHYWWPNINFDIRQYIRTCDSCQRMKARSTQKAGTLMPLPIPDRNWDSVSMDLITSLPVTKRGNSAILVMVDRLSKMVHLAATTNSVNAVGIGDLFFDNVIRLHGCPRDIVSDRDPRFIAPFMQEVSSRWGTKLSTSTAFHPQTDGQTERVNRVVEEMLRAFTSPSQDDWDEQLAAAEFAINNAYHESTLTTPFMLNSGQHPRLPLGDPASFPAPLTRLLDSTDGPGRVPAADIFCNRLMKALALAKKALRDAQSRATQQANKRRKAVTLHVGQQVMLSTKNIKLKLPSGGTPKLMPRYIGPFTIIKQINPVAFRLDLPPSIRIHNVFHISLLTLYNLGGSVQPPPSPTSIEDEGLFFKVEKLLKHRERSFGKGRTRLEFLVRYSGYGPEHDTWEPVSNLANCEQDIQKFLRKASSETVISPPRRRTNNLRTVDKSQSMSTRKDLKRAVIADLSRSLGSKQKLTQTLEPSLSRLTDDITSLSGYLPHAHSNKRQAALPQRFIDS